MSELNQKLKQAVHDNNIAEIHAALQAGGDPNHVVNNDRDTLFMSACAHKRPEIVEALTKGQVDYSARNRWGQYALHLAAIYGNTRVIRFLVEHGADLECMETYAGTPLISALSYMKPKTVRLLINLGANIHARTYIGNTPIQYLVRSESYFARMVLYPEHYCNRAQIEILYDLVLTGANLDEVDSFVSSWLRLHPPLRWSEELRPLLRERGLKVTGTRKHLNELYHALEGFERIQALYGLRQISSLPPEIMLPILATATRMSEVEFRSRLTYLLDHMTAKGLKEELKRAGMPVSGTKAQFLERYCMF